MSVRKWWGGEIEKAKNRMFMNTTHEELEELLSQPAWIAAWKYNWRHDQVFQASIFVALLGLAILGLAMLAGSL